MLVRRDMSGEWVSKAVLPSHKLDCRSMMAKFASFSSFFFFFFWPSAHIFTRHKLLRQSLERVHLETVICSLAFRRSDYRESWKGRKDVFCPTAIITPPLLLASIRLTLYGCVTFLCFSFSLSNPPPHVHWLKQPACWWRYWYQTTLTVQNCV